MRSFSVLVLAAGSAVTMAVMLGCSPFVPIVPARVLALSPLEPMDRVVILVTANDERERLLKSLAEAGLDTSGSFQNATLFLNVRLGRPMAKARCGSRRNIHYELRQEGRTIAIIRARGFTGQCSPNVLDEASQALGELLE